MAFNAQRGITIGQISILRPLWSDKCEYLPLSKVLKTSKNETDTEASTSGSEAGHNSSRFKPSPGHVFQLFDQVHLINIVTHHSLPK